MRHRITFEIEAREVEDFARLGICTPPTEFKIEPIDMTPALQALIHQGFIDPLWAPPMSIFDPRHSPGPMK